MDQTKSKICSEVDSISDSLFDISQYLLDNPETAYQEVKACEHLSGKMEEFGFQVDRGVGNVETAFLAKPAGCKPSRPTVAIMAEYDALPKIGHGCGHNLIASAGVGAAVALRKFYGESRGIQKLNKRTNRILLVYYLYSAGAIFVKHLIRSYLSTDYSQKTYSENLTCG